MQELHHEAESGYKLLQPEEIQSQLRLQGIHQHCQYQSVTESTNTDVVNYYNETQQVSIAFAEKQTIGKGRRGRQWLSPFARNIYCTVGIEKALSPAHLGLLSIVSGLAICQALADCGIDAVKLKWPNDLVYQRQKLGGILIESKPTLNGSYFFAIGFGINVHMTQGDLQSIPQAVTSLDIISPGLCSRQDILLAAIQAIVKNITEFYEADTALLIERFSEYDAFHQQEVCVINADQEIYGSNAGIDENGHLRLQTKQGIQVFSAAEISLREPC